MKDFKLIKMMVAAMLAMVMVLGLAGCGSGPDSEEAASDSDAGNEVVAEETNETASISPELKEMLDAYESWVDGYCDFAVKYSESGDQMAMLSDLTELLKEETEWAKKLEAVDQDSMTKEELDYYLDVTLRCSQKLLDAADRMN